jgi:hypothetical protein
MSKKRRSKSATNSTDMSNDNYEKESAINDTEVTVVETAVEAPANVVEPAVEAVEAPANVVEPAVEAVKAPSNVVEPALEEFEEPVLPSVNPPTVPLEVLLAVFKKRTVDSIDPALWVKAVDAVKQGRTVVLRGYAPHIDITEDAFNASGELPIGVSSPTSVLNNLLTGLV